MAAKRVRDGKITANFYTDGWPVFSTVVCQLLKPRLSDVGHVEVYEHTCTKASFVYCYGDSSFVSFLPSYCRRQTFCATQVPRRDYCML